MMSQFSQPIVCPVLVGRDNALADLRRMAVESEARGRVVFLSGEAGIGKSRLLAEFLEQLSAAGIGVWRATFYEQDTAAPYGGIRRLLDDLARHERAPQLFNSVAGDLRPIAPASVLEHGATAPQSTTVTEVEERRVLEAIRRLMRDLCHEERAVLAFEDVHWADSPSLAASWKSPGMRIAAVSGRPGSRCCRPRHL